MANNEQRGAAQTAADLAQKLKALINILRGLAAGGLHGAAVAAVKEVLPFLVKLAVGIIIFMVVTSMVIFTAIPNIFFGFSSAQDRQRGPT